MKNILYLHCHDAGRYLSPYGYALPTPNLHAFAARATLFRQAYCAGPTCSPSRAALLTGRYPHEAGMLGLAHRGFGLKDPRQHLAAFLKRHGYETVLSGIQHEFHEDHHPAEEVYDRMLPWPETIHGDKTKMDPAIAQNAADFLRETKDNDAPFFLSCGFVFPHRAFVPNDRFNPNYVMPPACLPDTPEMRKDWSEYMRTVEIMDEAAGKVLDALRASGRDKDTIVIFTTDHGVAFPWMKCNLYDAGMGVALMIDFPDNPRRGHAVDSLVSHLELFPTLCDYLGFTPPEGLRGHSLRPLFDGEAEELRDEVFSEVTYHAGYEPKRAVRTRRYKLIRWYDNDPTPVLANCDDGYAKEQLVAGGWTHH